MNANKILVLALAGAVVGLAGCSTFSKKGDPTAFGGPGDDVDQAYVARVNAEATARGYGVLWLHPPQKSEVAGRR